MKKIIGILVLLVAFSTQGQRKQMKKTAKLSAEQHANLALKKMTLHLDLTTEQQQEIKPLIMAQAAARKTAMEAKEKAKEEKKKPTADEIYEMKSKKLDNLITMKNRMKEILDKKQFEKFEKMDQRRRAMVMKKVKKHKKQKMYKDQETDDSK